jgi:hypothetical protein
MTAREFDRFWKWFKRSRLRMLGHERTNRKLQEMGVTL